MLKRLRSFWRWWNGYRPHEWDYDSRSGMMRRVINGEAQYRDATRDEWAEFQSMRQW